MLLSTIFTVTLLVVASCASTKFRDPVLSDEVLLCIFSFALDYAGGLKLVSRRWNGLIRKAIVRQVSFTDAGMRESGDKFKVLEYLENKVTLLEANGLDEHIQPICLAFMMEYEGGDAEGIYELSVVGKGRFMVPEVAAAVLVRWYLSVDRYRALGLIQDFGQRHYVERRCQWAAHVLRAVCEATSLLPAGEHVEWGSEAQVDRFVRQTLFNLKVIARFG